MSRVLHMEGAMHTEYLIFRESSLRVCARVQVFLEQIFQAIWKHQLLFRILPSTSLT